MDTTISDFDLKIRYEIYRFLADQCKAPTTHELAGNLSLAEEDVRKSFFQLNANHMIFLERGTEFIRMAFPFSAIPTRFKVKSGQKEWWANCAWDAFGIAAALNMDVLIEAAYPDDQSTIEFQVNQHQVDGKNHVVHFPLPCQQWYDDLVFT
jgi:hypothetical protein